MNELPFPSEAGGPAVIQKIQQDIEWLKDVVRSQKVIQGSPTIRVSPTDIGTQLEVDPSSLASEEALPVWLP